MTNEEAVKVLKRTSCYECAMGCVSASTCEGYDCDLKIATNMAIKALEQQPSEDCISRAKALEMLGDEPENWTDTEKEIQEVNDYRWFKSILEELPPVTPTRPKGKWIQTKDECDGVNFYNFSFECSKCGKEQSFKSTFCPICGAYMREVKE